MRPNKKDDSAWFEMNPERMYRLRLRINPYQKVLSIWPFNVASIHVIIRRSKNGGVIVGPLPAEVESRFEGGGISALDFDSILSVYAHNIVAKEAKKLTFRNTVLSSMSLLINKFKTLRNSK